MSEELPSDFDLVVVGTGLSESIIAAAASRIGKKVLHIDCNDYYGDLWASFNFDGFNKFIQEHQEKDNVSIDGPTVAQDIVKPDEKLIKVNSYSPLIKNIATEWFTNERKTAAENASEEKETTEKNDSVTSEAKQDLKPENKIWTQVDLQNDSRKFNIDLTPKLLYSCGDLVELLISSNIARYAEFRNVSRVLTWYQDSIQTVPCSRADVFATKQVNVVEKRMLMKLITELMDEKKVWPDNILNDTFNNCLLKHKLSPNIIHYVLYSMSLSTVETSFKEGLRKIRLFLKSLGRYGNTPFLWTMYGSGELPQCFCRLCAVFGGVYCLNRPIHYVILNSNGECSGVYIGEQRVNTSNVVLGISRAPSEFLNGDILSRNISHGVFITPKSIMDCDKENVSFLRFPPIDGQHPCNVIEVGSATGACPNNLYIVYMYKKGEKNSKEDLAPFVQRLFKVVESDNSTKPELLWAAYYNVPDTSEINFSKLSDPTIPSNMYLCSGPDVGINYEFPIKQAKDIFEKIYPNEEFLPRAPDPEEIVLDDEPTEDNEVAETTEETVE